MWYFFGFVGFVVCLVGMAIYLIAKPSDDRYLEVKTIAGPTYQPNPKPYVERKVTEEDWERAKEKAEYEVLF